MITTKIDGNTVELRNLQEQVQKNKEDIEYIINEEGALNQFGLRVVGQVEDIDNMPTIQAYKESNPKWEYGDAFMVGKSTAEATVVDIDNATLLVLTRANTVYPNDFWMNLGKFPKPGPVGPVGPKGEQGIQGVKGIGVLSGSSDPTASAPATTTYINATTGDVFVYSGQKWDKIGNIKGATGSIGPVGPKGSTGPIGPKGATGPQGPRGIGVNILGTLTSTSQLPNPTTVGKDSAYIIPADGVNHLWVIEGTTNLVWTDFGTAGLGEKGDKGDDGVGIDTMTDLDLTYGNATVDYNTTNGMTVNGQARFTYGGGTTKDVTMDMEIPIVAGEGITVGKKASEEKVEVKLDKTFTDGKYVPKTNTPWRLYVTDGSGNQSTVNYTYLADWNAIVQRDAGGRAKVNTPLSDNDIANKAYVDDHFAPLLTTDNPNYPYFYTVYGSDAPVLIGGSQGTAPNTVAVRDAGGHINVATPTTISHATTKAYVDGLHHYVHIISLDGNSSHIYITVSAKGKPNPITTIDEEGNNTSLASLLYASVHESKCMATGMVQDSNGNTFTVTNLSSDGASVSVGYIDFNSITNTLLLPLDTFTITDTVV